jgi:hypothetical protein
MVVHREHQVIFGRKGMIMLADASLSLRSNLFFFVVTSSSVGASLLRAG